LRVIRCPTLQVSQFLFPGQRSDTFLTDHLYQVWYVNKPQNNLITYWKPNHCTQMLKFHNL